MRGIRLAVMLKVLFIIVFNFSAAAQATFNKQAFYDAMNGSDINQIELQIKEAEKAKGLDKQAMIGTLTMKKAGLSSGAGKKLKIFKAGHKELEASIKQDNTNAEYRFMRLMIQEHAPGILGYKKEIKGDSDYIRKSFKSLPEPVQKAIIHYAKSSKVLSEKDFN